MVEWILIYWIDVVLHNKWLQWCGGDVLVYHLEARLDSLNLVCATTKRDGVWKIKEKKMLNRKYVKNLFERDASRRLFLIAKLLPPVNQREKMHGMKKKATFYPLSSGIAGSMCRASEKRLSSPMSKILAFMCHQNHQAMQAGSGLQKWKRLNPYIYMFVALFLLSIVRYFFPGFWIISVCGRKKEGIIRYI